MPELIRRAELEAWLLKICNEALAVDPTAATEVIEALTHGQDVFCPQAHSSDRLHKAGAAFLRIARLV